ncbi:MAG: hypothetical protein JNM94_06475 [Phycisphaerae bacterium]|nr:hypothetical protein [Phycisphaerae bacterium]
MTDAALAGAWIDAALDVRIRAALGAIYDAVADEVAARRPLCLASGHCCQFERYGHRLYVSGLEAAVTMLERQEAGAPCGPSDVAAARAAGTCPFLRDGRLCGAHAWRPLGCRVYFCDRTAGTGGDPSWQETLYERLHAAIKSLHEEFGVPYRYGEWRDLLGILAAPATTGARGPEPADADPRAADRSG